MLKPKIRGDAMRDAILDVASELFIAHGFDGTTMNDIARAVGMTRTVVYYYFKNKESILVALTQGATKIPVAASLPAKATKLDPVAEMHALVRDHAKQIMSHPLQVRVVERSENDLPAKLRERGRTARRLFLDKFTTVIQGGVRSGHFRDVDPRVAAFAMIGMCNWTAWWFKPSGPRTLDEIAEMLADYAIHALRRDDPRRPAKAGVSEAIRLLKEDISYLEQQALGLNNGGDPKRPRGG